MSANWQQISEGMTVFGADGRQVGVVEKLRRDQFMVNGQAIGQSGIARVTREGIYLADGGAMQSVGDEGEIRIQVAEERLLVGKREVDLGAVEIRKTVIQEEQTASVTLRRDEVHIEEVDIADRPLRAGEGAFEEGTIRVQLRGEEAVVAKEAVVTGEVVIDKETVAEQRTVSGTVRQEHIDVEENYKQTRADLQQGDAARRASDKPL